VSGDHQNEGKLAKALFKRVLCGCLALIGWHVASAQMPAESSQTVPPRVSVSLASDACPVVHARQSISLDWNPGFEHLGAITGIRTFRLTFGALAENGLTVRKKAPQVLGGRDQQFTAAATQNGYFHFEVSVPRTLAPGEYHLIGAEAIATALPEYQGPAIQMTNSPVAARLCFTIETAKRP